MKLLVLLFIISGCSHVTLEEKECITDQVDYYDDLCAESSTGYEEMLAIDAHYEGVKCAIETVLMCLGEL